MGEYLLSDILPAIKSTSFLFIRKQTYKTLYQEQVMVCQKDLFMRYG